MYVIVQTKYKSADSVVCHRCWWVKQRNVEESKCGKAEMWTMGQRKRRIIIIRKGFAVALPSLQEVDI